MKLKKQMKEFLALIKGVKFKVASKIVSSLCKNSLKIAGKGVKFVTLASFVGLISGIIGGTVDFSLATCLQHLLQKRKLCQD